MAQNFPTLSQLKATFLSNYESNLNQTSPLNDKALTRVQSAVLAIIATLMQKEVINNTKENLAITASREGLIDIGNEYDLPIKEAVSTVLTVSLPATNGTEIPANTNFTGDTNGVLYFNNASVIASGGVAVLNVTSRTPGVIGNLQPGISTLTISRQIAGAELIATITAIETTGAEAEDTEVYRQRVLDIIRAPGGGANSADFRNWAQEQEGVARAYPYAGVAFGDPAFPGGSPPERTVYIEAQTDIDPDGIAPQSLLDDTRDTIITNLVTGIERQPLGITNDTLYVVSIRRTSIFTQISGATFQTGTEAQVKADIETAVDNYYLGLRPFVQGLDIDADRNDTITALTISEVVQDILKANSASATGIVFGLAPGSFLPEYQLGQGELTKNGGITYA